MRRRATLLLVTVATLIGSLTAGSAHGDHGGAGWSHWADPPGPTGWSWINVIDRTPQGYIGNIVYEEAIAWMFGPGRGHDPNGIYIAYTREDPAYGCNPVENAIVVCWSYLPYPYSATTGMYARGSHIPRTEVKIDDSVLYETESFKRGVIRHELGHALGFDHSSQGGPMGGGYAFTQHDYDVFYALYMAHND